MATSRRPPPGAGTAAEGRGILAREPPRRRRQGQDVCVRAAATRADLQALGDAAPQGRSWVHPEPPESLCDLLLLALLPYPGRRLPGGSWRSLAVALRGQGQN